MKKKNLKILVIIILVVIVVVLGYFVYDRMIFKKNKIFTNIKNEVNLKIVHKDYHPTPRILFESDNQEMIHEIINLFDNVKVKKNTKLLMTGNRPYVISGENFSITFNVLNNILIVNGKKYDVKVDSRNESLFELIDSIFKKYGIENKD